jgi:hypothetical protein
MDQDVDKSRIRVLSNRDWFGSPGLGTFAVYLDGSPVGKLPPVGAVDVQCEPGSHAIRIRQFWLLSKPYEVNLSAGEILSLVAGISKTGRLFQRMLQFYVHPGRALLLTRVDDASS